MRFVNRIFLIIAFSFGVFSSGFSKDIPGSFAELAEKLMPSVVNISTTTTITTKSNPFPFQFPPGSPFKDMFEGAPKEIKAGVPKKEADEFKKKLEAAGAKVELK